MKSQSVFLSIFLGLLSMSSLAASETNCITPLIPASASATAQVMLQATTQLSSVAFTGMPSVNSVETCEMADGRNLYVVKGRNHAGCFLGNKFKLMIEVKSPKFNGDHFDFDLAYSEEE